MKLLILALTILSTFLEATEVKKSKENVERTKRQWPWSNNNNGLRLADVVPLLMMSMQTQAPPQMPMYMPAPAQPQIITVTVPVPTYARREYLNKRCPVNGKCAHSQDPPKVGQEVHKTQGGTKVTNKGTRIFPRAWGQTALEGPNAEG